MSVCSAGRQDVFIACCLSDYIASMSVGTSFILVDTTACSRELQCLAMHTAWLIRTALHAFVTQVGQYHLHSSVDVQR